MRRRTAAPDEDPVGEAVEVLMPPGAGEEMSADNKVRAAEQEAATGLGEDDEAPKSPPAGCCFPETSPGWVAAKLGVCVLAGLVFGLALEKGRVYEPAAIRNQMVFKQWTMLKIFLTAMATGQLVFGVISVTPFLRPLYIRISAVFMSTLDDKGILTSVVGPFLLGVGMTICGACPGMLLAQVGSWTKNAIFTYIAALAGALFYGLFQPLIAKITKPSKPFTYSTISDHTRWFYGWIAFPMSIVLLGITACLEYFIPWNADLPKLSQNPINGTSNPFDLKGWPPFVSGVMIGILQLFTVLTVKDTLGGSASYMTMVSQWVVPFRLQNTFPHLAMYRCGLANWWKVFYALAAMLGSFISSYLSGTTGTVPGVGLPWAIGGGFLISIGAQLGAGCTSVHGLSGAAMLFYVSLIAVPAMFAGGISMAFTLKVFEPEAIRNQMVFKQWTMLKMFIAAMATGQLVFALMSVIPNMRPLFSYIYLLFIQTLKEKGILTTTLGPFILGVGMTLAGACPGMVLAQMGSWTKNAVFTFIGALLGALVFGMCQPFIRKLTMPAKSFKTFSLSDHTGVFFGWFAFPMAIALLGAVAALEYFIPWHEDLPIWSRNENDTTNLLFLKAWPPSVAGAMIGVLQLLVAVSVKDTLGGSSSYMTLCAQWVIPARVQNAFPHLAKFRCGLSNWWQVFYVGSAMLGALGSSCLSGSTGTTRGVELPWAISGGFLMVFGARLSSGCTSGHGLSGAGMLIYMSLVAVPVMFAGGIGTAFAMQGFGILNNYVCPEGPCTNAT